VIVYATNNREMTATIMKSVNVGIRIPQETLNKLDKYKGYYSRNRFLCKILDEHVAQLECASTKEEVAVPKIIGEQTEK
jgi:hypothetical protein